MKTPNFPVPLLQPLKKRSSSNLQIAATVGQSVLEQQRRLVHLVHETARKISEMFLEIRLLQQRLMKGVAEFLGNDHCIIDAASLSLVQDCACVFEAVSSSLRCEGLQNVDKACQQVLEEYDRLSASLISTGEASRETMHYEDKVANLEQQAVGGDKLHRNIGKLEQAKGVLNMNNSACQELMNSFEEKRTVDLRKTLHAMLSCYSKMVSAWGSAMKPVADQFLVEFEVGSCVEVVGLQKARELNGQVVVVESIVEAEGRCVVIAANGEQKAIRFENLRPTGSSASAPLACVEEPNSASNCDEESESEPSLEEPPITISPTTGAIEGGYEAELVCRGLDGDVCEVLVGGRHAEVIDVSRDTGSCTVRFRMPPGANGSTHVDVRTEGWQRHMARGEDVFQYFRTVRFGEVGRNVVLDDAPEVASRTEGLLHGVAFTMDPLNCLEVHESWQERYYFEFKVLEVLEKASMRTLSLGFAWPPPSEAQQGTDAKKLHLPELSHRLPFAVVVGGELPKVYLEGTDHAKLSGWRPKMDVVAGSVVGGLFERDETSGRVSVFQDGRCRCSTTFQVPAKWIGAPHGVVDICGTVLRVVLLQQSEAPLVSDLSGILSRPSVGSIGDGTDVKSESVRSCGVSSSGLSGQQSHGLAR